MRKSVCCFVFCLLFMVPILAASAPAYSLGTMQPINVYVTNPGKTVPIEFYIFNAYGNRVTHVIISVVENLDNLQVQLPPLKTNMWNISGIMTPIQENLYVEPMPMVAEKPANPPAGVYYLKTTNVTDYIPAKKVTVDVTIPADAPLGVEYKLNLMADANWYGELGTAQVSQSRPFSYRLVVVAENYSETLYNQPSEEGGGLSITGWGIVLTNELMFGIVIAVLVIVILFQQFRSKGRR